MHNSASETGLAILLWKESKANFELYTYDEKTMIVRIVGCFLGAGCSSASEEKDPEEDLQVTLYDRETEAIAYIDYEDDSTIYTFEGEPLAYIEADKWVYGFNGKLLGWYSESVLYDRSYYAAGAKRRWWSFWLVEKMKVRQSKHPFTYWG